MKLIHLAIAVASVAAGPAVLAEPDPGRPLPQVPTRTPAPWGDAGNRLRIDLTNWKSAVAIGDSIGKIEMGLFCSDGRPLSYSKTLDDTLPRNLRTLLKDRLTALGILAPDAAGSLFEDKGSQGLDYRLGATLLEIGFRVCGREEAKGDLYAKIKWEAFSTRRQQVIYSATVDASFSSPKALPNADFYRGLRLAIIDNLLGDPAFVEAIRSGGSGAEVAAAPSALTISPGPTVGGSISKGAAGFLDAVVTVESNVGSGSGFYISHDGYLLTNQHVVADSKFVRVKLANGRSLVGEVLRVDKPRDVALLRTDPVTTGVLAVRREPAQTGEEVYALGSPFGEVLSGTLTRGVLSARRVFEGVAYLQSDVTVNPGNSGGPLTDANGQVLGLVKGGIPGRGINLFVPIEDALDKLAVRTN